VLTRDHSEVGVRTPRSAQAIEPKKLAIEEVVGMPR